MPIAYPDILSLNSENEPFEYTDRETMLYALGVGMGSDPLDARELPFVYESGLRVLPTQASVMAWGAGRLGESGINYIMVVHGEQRLTIHRPLPSSAKLLADSRITGCYDKGPKGAVLVMETDLKLAHNQEKLATLGMTIMARGDGGFGGPAEGGPVPHPVPEGRAPDVELAIPTRPDQALIYRLSGDRNPLHADPAFAAMAGFPRPILHGLCTYGITCRAVLASFADHDPTRIRAHDVRFSAPVFPGETVTTRMWRDGNVISFDAVVAARNAVVIRNGRCVLAG